MIEGATLRLALALALASAGCDVSPAGPGAQGTGEAGDASAAPTCPRGVLVASSDYMSTSVSVLAPDGRVLAPTLVSSRAAAPGLSAALSGDVVFPHDAPPSGDAVLLDRFPASVLTWVEPSSAKVLRQLAVRTGFASNPHDYLEVRAEKAYVTRYGSNPTPGKEPFDKGGDLLIIDPTRPAVTGTVDLTAEGGGLPPRPDRMTRVGDEVLVALDRIDDDFKRALDARIVGVRVADDRVAWRVDLPGLANCGGLVRSPSGRMLAVACSGAFSDGDRQIARSGIVLLDLTRSPPRELARHAIAVKLGAPLTKSIAFASDEVLVGVAYGDAQKGRRDVAYTLDLTTREAAVLFTAPSAFSLGEVLCTPGCGDRCFITDADASHLVTYTLEGRTLGEGTPVRVDTAFGLPPRSFGSF